MVTGFRRSISLSGSSPFASPARRHHLRSISLPCRSHPALSHLLDQIRSAQDHGPRASSLSLERIDRLLAALDDLLRLPKAHDALHRNPAWADRLLDGFLRLADSHGSFRSAAVGIKHHNADARAAIRRDDPARLASTARSYRRAAKDLARLAAAVKDLARSAPVTSGIWADAAEAEVAGIVTEAVAAAAATSMEVFLGIAAVSSSVADSTSKGSWMVWPTRKSSKGRKEESDMTALEELEECVGGLEQGSDRVFRSLMNIRVSLLNILTPCFLIWE